MGTSTARHHHEVALSERRLFSRHGRALVHIHRHPGQTAVEIADALAITVGTLWTVLGDLREAGMLRVEVRDRHHIYYVNENAAIEDPVADAAPVRTILDALTH